MINYSKKYFVVVALFLSLFIPNLGILADTQDTPSISVSRFEVYTDPEKDSYLTGEEIVFFTGIGLSDDSGLIRNSTLEIKIPKEFIVPNSFVASDINSQISKEVSQDATHYIVQYKLIPFTSGASLDIPVKFSTHNGNTPDNFKINVEANFYDENMEPLVTLSEKTFTVTTKKPTGTKFIRNNSWTSANNQNTLGGKEDPNKEGYLSENLNDLDYVEFSYRLTANTSISQPGNRYYEKIVFEDKLPEGAVFVSEDNPGWTYDSDTRIAKYEYIPSGIMNIGDIYFYNYNVILKLKFPGAKLNETFTNNATIKATPKDKADYEDVIETSDPIDFKLRARAGHTGFLLSKTNSSLYFDLEKAKSGVVAWNVYLRNTANALEQPNHNLENVVIEDKNLDSNLKYTGVNFYGMSTNVFVGSVDIIVTYNDDTTETIASNVSLISSQTIDFPENVKSFKVKFTEGSYLLPGQYFYMYPQTRFVNPSQKILALGETNKYLYNSATATGNYISQSENNNTATGFIRVVPAEPKIRLQKNVVSQKSTYFVKDKIDYQLFVHTNSLIEDEKIDTNSLIDILPVGMEYVPNSSYRYVYTSNVQTDMISQYTEPTVVHNYEGTGQTALIWDLDDITSKTTPYPSSLIAAFYINYSTRITNLTNQGSNVNSAYLSWKDVDNVKAYSGSTKDIYDLNNNGSTEDFIAGANATINYVPPKELIVKKEVMGSLDDKYILPPSEGLSEIGTTVDYKLTLFNNSVNDYRTIYVVDLFPNLEDKTTSVDQTLLIPSRVERNSTFKLKLAKPITPPAGFEIYYTQDEIDEDAKTFTNTATWTSTLSDYSKATAFKMVLKEGEVFASGEEKNFLVSYDIPKDYDLTKNDKAVNSFGTAVSHGLNYIESNMSTVRLVKYNVDGYVFDDFNVNGKYDTDVDKPFKNYLVQLVDEDGEVVNDLDGNPYEVKTDKNGYYSIEVYRQGDYKIKVITPEGYNLTEESDDELGSHIISETNGLSDKFDLNYQKENERKNAGYYRDKATLSFEKELQNSLGEPLENDDLFDFIITVADELYEGKAVLDGEEITISEGKLSMGGGSKLVIEDIDKNASYKMEEVNNDNYIVTPSASMYKDNLNQTFINHIFINKYVSPKTDITVEKEWVDAPTIKPTIKVQLYRNGKSYGDVITLKNGKTEYTWKNLDERDENGDKYQYSVDEIDLPKNYKKEVDDFVITNTYTAKDNSGDESTNLPKTGQDVLSLVVILLILIGSSTSVLKYRN